MLYRGFRKYCGLLPVSESGDGSLTLFQSAKHSGYNPEGHVGKDKEPQ
jgi:hypothetical protein